MVLKLFFYIVLKLYFFHRKTEGRGQEPYEKKPVFSLKGLFHFQLHTYFRYCNALATDNALVRSQGQTLGTYERVERIGCGKYAKGKVSPMA